MIYTRQQLEEYENQTQAPTPFIAKTRPQGTRLPGRGSGIPHQFQRDRERVLHTTAFRPSGIQNPGIQPTTKVITTACV
jgi:hypothetical protein